MLRVIATAIAVLALASCSEKTVTRPPADSVVVGMMQRDFQDTERRSWGRKSLRPLATTIWYPAAPDAKMAEIAFPADDPVFVGGWAAKDAAMADGGKLPLVVLSHGTGGSALQMMWLGRRLAAKGFVVAAVDHHGNTAAEAEFDARGFRMPWERARDISAVIDQLLGDPVFGARIDASRMAGAGFSLGGYTMTALAGGRTSLARLAAFCESDARDATCEAQPEYPGAEDDFARMLKSDGALRVALAGHAGSFADPRLGSYVLLAPALVQAFTDDSLLGIGSPILVIVGENDVVAPAATNARRIADKVRASTIEMIGGAGHFTLLDECAPKKRRVVRACRDAGGTDRRAVHDKTADLAANYFEATLAAK